MIDLDEIFQRLSHAFPFRMIDRVLEIEPGKRAIAIKNVSVDEPFLKGHFQKDPILPWVLIVEAMAQAGGMAFHSSGGEEEEGVPFLARIEEFRLKRNVVPGDQVVLEAEVLHLFSNLAKVKVLAKVSEEVVAEGTLVLAKGSQPIR
jgi:3-hydroxyacyl-[acyl-carrier-protein] dehydratase